MKNENIKINLIQNINETKKKLKQHSYGTSSAISSSITLSMLQNSSINKFSKKLIKRFH